MSPKLYLIAGHTQGKGEGAQNLQTKETENMVARDLLLDIFRINGFFGGKENRNSVKC